MNKRNTSSKRGSGSKVKREQPRKDSDSKRVNFDNMSRSEFEKEFKSKKTSGSNDVSWYAKNQELLTSAASLPYSTSTGLQLPFTSQKSVPGVLAMFWEPGIGTNQVNSVNQAANMMYSNVVHANSRNTKYNSPDLLLLVLAGAELFRTIAYGVRAYGEMRRFEQENAYTPDAIITAMGFDYQDLKKNLSNMWFDLNEIISRASQIWVPNTIPVMERWFWMNSNIYKDGESVKSQYYMFVPETFYVYQETTSETGGQLALDTIWGSTSEAIQKQQYKKWSDFLSLVERQFSALLDSEDRGIIFGDILKAYGKENLYTVKEITADYAIVPVYDREVLTQIENSVSVNAVFGGFNQNPDTNTIGVTWNEVDVNDPSLAVPTNQILNFHQTTVPTPAQNMVATRLKVGGATYKYVTVGTPEQLNTQPIVQITSMGTEFIRRNVLISYNWNEGVKSISWNWASSCLNLTSSAFTDNTVMYLAKWSAFDWSPWIYNIKSYTIPGGQSDLFIARPATTYHTFGDYDFYTVIDQATLNKMHLTAVYSELGVQSLL